MFFKSKVKHEEINDEPVPSRIDGIIKDEDQFRRDTIDFLATLCSVLVKSYGPLGSNTLIEKLGTTPTITKDGYTILNSLIFSNSQDKAVHDLIKRVSYNLVKTVGDGSTSAVLSASFVYEYLSGIGYSRYDQNGETIHNSKKLVNLLEYIVEYLVNDLETSALTINEYNKRQILTSIASISNNNDLKIGDYIAGIFNKLSYMSDVRIEEDPNDSTTPLTHKIRHGFSYERGPVHNLYFNKVKSSALAVVNPLIYMSYEFFPEHYENLKLVQKDNPNRAIVVITEVTHEETINECLSDYLKDKNKIIIIRTNDMAVESIHNEFLDLAIYLDSDCVRDPLKFESSQLGACKSVEFFGNKTVFISGDGITKHTQFFTERINDLQKEYDSIPNNLPSQRGMIKKRLSKLNGVTVSILVGGITEEEKKSRRFLVEDAVLACKSAMSKGYGFGGNVNLFFAMKRLLSKVDGLHEKDFRFREFDKDYIRIVCKLLQQAYFDTYFCILNKSPKAILNHDEFKNLIYQYDDKIFNVMTGEMENIVSTTVLAPIDTDIQILKASISIVGMLLSINQFVSC